MDLLSFCKGCFGDEAPDLCELYRRHFILLHHLRPSTYRLIKQVVEQNGSHFRIMAGNRWGFQTTKDNHQHILNMLNICSVSVHTLEEHVKNLESRYNAEPLKLGKQCYVNQLSGENWRVLNPQTRSWCMLHPVYSGILLREGSIYCCELHGENKYYWFKNISEDGTPKIIEIKKRAAWNIAVRYFEPKLAYWIEDNELGIGVVTTDSLGGLPDDIFATLVKFRPLEKHLPGLLIFEKDDYELVKKVLSCINTKLIKSTNVTMLPGDPDKLHGTPIIPISEMPLDRVNSIKTILSKISGSDVISSDDCIKIKSDKKEMKIIFIGKSRGCTVNGTFYVPMGAIEDAHRIYGLFQAVSKYFKSNIDIEKFFVLNWCARNEADLSYILDAFIRYLDDAEFVEAFLKVQKNYEIIHQWYDSTTKDYLNVNVPFDMLKKVGRYLTKMAKI
ncbi:MAG: hypothetical protein WHU54_02415 [Candidatus Bathyarchaeia archaeon]